MCSFESNIKLKDFEMKSFVCAFTDFCVKATKHEHKKLKPSAINSEHIEGEHIIIIITGKKRERKTQLIILPLVAKLRNKQLTFVLLSSKILCHCERYVSFIPYRIWFFVYFLA